MKKTLTVSKARNENDVVKANDLIQRSKYELNLFEQKALAYCISKIKAFDLVEEHWKLEYEFDIIEFCKVCGIDYDNGKNYKNIKLCLERLSNRSMWVDFQDGTGNEVLCRWLDKVIINRRSGKVGIRFDKDLIPYLFGMQKNFTQYQLSNILAMKSSYSVRLYELLKSNAWKKRVEYTIDEFRSLMGLEMSVEELERMGEKNPKAISKFKRYPDLRRYVIEQGVEEINALTDLKVSYEPITEGQRKVVGVAFHIDNKTSLESVVTNIEVNEILDAPGRTRKLDKGKKTQKRSNMTPEEKERYKRATENAEQLNLYQGGMEQ